MPCRHDKRQLCSEVKSEGEKKHKILMTYLIFQLLKLAETKKF